MEVRTGIYIVMACAFGACVEDDPDYCTREQAACVCKPTMKLDMSTTEPSGGRVGPLCNNATFDWMIQTMLTQITDLNQRISNFDTERQKYQDEVEVVQGMNLELQEVIWGKNKKIQMMREENSGLHDRVEDLEHREPKLQAEDSSQELIELHQKISDLETNVRKLNFENIRLKEENELANEELQQLKQQTKKMPKDCADIQRDGSMYSGVFTIHPDGVTDPEGVEVFCDLHTDGGGWLMIQRRQDGSQRFDVDWATYKKGFGKVAREFWLGNELLHQMTSHQGEYELRIDMMDVKGLTGHAHYTKFLVDDETSGYKLHVGGYSGSVGDAMIHHDDAPFSTIDVDNDESRSGHCSQLYGHGGWWFVRCYDSNLNGRFGRNDKTGIEWFHWKDHHTLRHVEMKIRPLNFAQKN